MTAPVASAEESHEHVPAALVGGGGLLVASLVGINLAQELEPLTAIRLALFGVHFVLAGTLVACGCWLATTDLPPERYGRVAGWCLGGAGLFLLLHVPMIAIRADFVTAVDWTHSAISFGAASGAVGGVIEAQTIERARTAEREAVRARTAEKQAERLEYLNTLLRHEVLNNANVISGYADLAHAESNGTVEEYLTTIRQQSEDMSAVIKDIRALIEAFQGDDSSERVDLSALLTDEVEDLRTVYEAVEVEATIPDDLYVLADDLLARVFGNLLSNAVEHNDSSTPRVAVTVEPTPETVTVRIEDNGPGVPEAKRAAVFENSTRGDHGVGLYLVWLLTDRYDGSVELAETGPEGTVFTVELPRAGVASTHATPPAAQ